MDIPNIPEHFQANSIRPYYGRVSAREIQHDFLSESEFRPMDEMPPRLRPQFLLHEASLTTKNLTNVKFPGSNMSNGNEDA